MARTFKELVAPIMADPIRRREVERERAKIQRVHDSRRWRFVRWLDRLTGRSS